VRSACVPPGSDPGSRRRDGGSGTSAARCPGAKKHFAGDESVNRAAIMSHQLKALVPADRRPDRASSPKLSSSAVGAAARGQESQGASPGDLCALQGARDW